MKRQETILGVPEFAIRDQRIVMGVPEFSMQEQKIIIGLPSITVKNVQVEIGKARKAGEALAQRTSREVAALNDELKIRIDESSAQEMGAMYDCYKKNILASRTSVVKQFDDNIAIAKSALDTARKVGASENTVAWEKTLNDLTAQEAAALAKLDQSIADMDAQARASFEKSAKRLTRVKPKA
jgi:hypothetical protein